MAARLQERMTAMGYRKQADLARDADVNAQTLGSYYLGDRGMRLQNARKIAKVLNTTAEWLMFGEGEPAIAEFNSKTSQAQVAPAKTQIRAFSIIDVPYLEKIQRGEFFEWPKMATLEDAGLLLGQDYTHLLSRRLP